MSNYYVYPFLKRLEEYFRERYGSDVNLERLFGMGVLRSKALERVKGAILGGKRKRVARPQGGEDEYISFYMGLLLAGLADRWALRKYVDSEVKTFVSLLGGESSKFVWDVSRRLGLMSELLARDDECGHKVILGTKPRPEISCFQYKVSVPKYLVYAEELLGEVSWSLASAYVERGHVYLPKSKYVRLLEEPLKNYLMKVFEDLSLKVIDLDSIADLREEVRDLVRKERGYTSDEELPGGYKTLGEVREEFFPPCIKELINSLKANEHLTHSQRFALATFLLNVGASAEYVLDLMKNAPDFNERMARYQIEHLAGMRGGGKKYRMYSCTHMGDLGMCVAECRVRTPIQYYLNHVKRAKPTGGSESARNQGF
ncbi:MAG: hypothetical protein QXP80_00960 [Zestosphaera sp.]